MEYDKVSKEIKDNRRILYPIQKEGTIHGKMLYLSETGYALTMNYVLHAPGESDQLEDTEPTLPVENVLATPSTTGDR